MTKFSHLNALIQKNAKIMKRKCSNTLCEIFFPIILMLLVVLLRKAFKIDEYYYSQTNDNDFIVSNSSAMTSQIYYHGLSKRETFSICRGRPTIGIVGQQFPQKLLDKLKSQMMLEKIHLSFQYFNSPDEIDAYIENEYYASDNEHPPICFGLRYEYIPTTNTYNVSLHYFATNLGNGIKDIPSTLVDPLDTFQKGPDMDSYERYLESGYLNIIKLIYDNILQNELEDDNAKINFGVIAQKYHMYQDDTFGKFIGFILPFFLVIAYLIPLSMQVSRWVGEKETKAKEGMKIMGLTEGVYFLSYFIQCAVMNTFYALINSGIMKQVFYNTNYIYLFGFFWLYGINVFALSFFFQSMMDKRRLAMIVSILLYFVMYFVSIAVISDEVANAPKMILSILPPTALQLGINTLAQFDSNAIEFDSSCVGIKYNNYSVSDMYIMFVVDFFLFLFLGYYLQNIISHEFGISRPFYFLCTGEYWGCKKKKSNNNKKVIAPETKKQMVGKDLQSFNNDSTPQYLNMKHGQRNNRLGLDDNGDDLEHKKYFQSEAIYATKTDPKDALRIKNLRKEFADGKIAVNNISFNLYKDEIFALLGHNGAGKSTTISMLSGLYSSSGGEANYDSMNILQDSNMDKFRSRLGICPQHDVLFDDLSVEEHLSMFCVFKGVESSRIKDEIAKSLKDFDLEPKKSERAGDLSAGQRRKLSIAIALIGGSEVIFLDEPSSGMDITSRRQLWDIVKEQVKGKIIVLTTHYMEEAAVLGKRIGIISNGEMKCIGTPLFLIEMFGKYISINIVKEPDANNGKIIDFVKKEVKDVKVDVLSEEILFRISKSKDFSLKDFFAKLDSKLSELKIKTYSASMPTLEDVFLNVSSMEKMSQKLSSISSMNEENDKILFDDSNYIMNQTPFKKSIVDLSVSLQKRLFQIIRDKRSFLLEILCPIILVLIGLGVSSVEFSQENPHFLLHPSQILSSQTIYYSDQIFQTRAEIPNDLISDNINQNFLFTKIPLSQTASETTSMISFMNSLFSINNATQLAKDAKSFAGYYFMNIDDEHHQYDFITFSNLQSRQSAVIYPVYMLNKIVAHSLKAKNKEITINVYNCPFQKTFKEQSDNAERSNSTLVFFVAVAFALIPANFITLIIKERETNSKHLQIISGISLIAYWTSNFISELVKYYFTGGICLIIIKLFDSFPKNFWVLYLLYGPSMVSFTYLFSFWFNDESSAQNVVILINFLFGALGGCVILVLRLIEDVSNIGKILSYIFRIVPSFCFCYGYNELLSSFSLLYIDYPDKWMTMTEGDLMKIEYVGMDILYMGVESVLFTLLLVVLENKSKCSSEKENDDISDDIEQNNNEISPNDSQVRNEIKKVNEVIKQDHEKDKYSIKVHNLTKKYYPGGICSCCSSEKVTTAVKDLSFAIEYGECFGLLGINGAGKTTTFKCLTNEISFSNGRILIANKDIHHEFQTIRSLIGYCPQFDAIFDYMTVYENLSFYASIKGISEEKKETVITALLNEMNLIQYRNKQSGQLSGGNKRKLSVSIAMICNPEIIFLDEPSTGMDPEARRFMWSVIHKISSRAKKSSVIITTHSMDEAETLCRRIGILVEGKFVCMGSATQIKEKYGDGFEINLQIKPMSESEFNEIQDKDIDLEEIKDFLCKINKGSLSYELNKGQNGLAYKLLRDKTKINMRKIGSWSYYVMSALNVIEKVKEHFSNVLLSENVENSFLFKVKKNEEDSKKSIGFLFGIVEDAKEKGNIEEYSIQQTSLEQIFNKFTNYQKDSKSNDGDDENVINQQNNEIEITQEMLDHILFNKKCE